MHMHRISTQPHIRCPVPAESNTLNNRSDNFLLMFRFAQAVRLEDCKQQVLENIPDSAIERSTCQETSHSCDTATSLGWKAYWVATKLQVKVQCMLGGHQTSQ